MTLSDAETQHEQIEALNRDGLCGEIVVQPLTLLLRDHLTRFHGGYGDARTIKDLMALHEAAHA